MTCATIQPLLEAFADHDLSPLTQWRIRRHLSQCPACTAELTEMDALTARVRAWQNVPAPAGLEARIAAALPAATPAPARPPVRRAAVGLAGLAAALAAAVWLVPGQPGRPTVAFAEVEQAMQNVQTVSYDLNFQMYDAQGHVLSGAAARALSQETPRSLHIWLRRAPAAEYYLDRTVAERLLQDGRGGVVYQIKKGIYIKYPLKENIEKEVNRQLRHLTEPMTVGSDASPNPAQKRTYSPWQQKKVTLNSVPCLKFTRTLFETFGSKHGTTNLSIWADAKTLRVVRVEHFGDAIWMPQGYQERGVLNNLRYDKVPPPGVFDWSPPPGAKVTGHW